MIAIAALLGAPDFATRPKLAHLSNQQLSAISSKCETPRSWLRYSRSGELHLRPSRTAKYQKVDCILRELKLRAAEPIGFVGNESPQ